MPSRITTTLLPLSALLLGVGVLLIGNGLQGTLLSVRGTIEGFRANEIGIITAGYFGGFIAGSLVGAHVIERAGHIRAFSAFASIASAAALFHVLLIDPTAWTVARATTGFCIAGLYMVIESWLNERADNQTRGQVLSAYMVVSLGGLALGQFLLTAANPADFHLFAIVSALISLALVPVALTKTTAPVPAPFQLYPPGRLYALSPLGVMGCLATGIGSGAFWGLGPVFAERIWNDATYTASFMGLTVAGGVALQWPIGRLSDRFDRRQVITAVCFLISVTSIGIVLTAEQYPLLMIAIATLFGGLVFPLYSLAVAHVNDYTGRDELVAVSGALLLVFGVGAMFGPIMAGYAMRTFGPSALFVFMAATFALVGAFALHRMMRRQALPPELQEAFVPVPRTSTVIYELDPRGHPEEADEEVPTAINDDDAPLSPQDTAPRS